MKIFSVLLFLTSLAFAQFPNKKTVIQVNEPLLVAGVPEVTLQPGKYILRLVDHDHNRNIVQIFTERDDKLVTTALAINNYRLKPTNKTVLRFWETPKGNPPALRAWFAPGDEWGQEFVYPKGVATRIAQASGGPVLTARAATEAELRAAPVTEVVKSGEEKALEQTFVTEPAPGKALPAVQTEAEVRAPATPPPAVAEPETVAVPATASRAATDVAAAPAQAASTAAAQEPLPATGSPMVAIGLGGLVLLVVGFAVRRTFYRPQA
jgi:hypothetical protein